MADIFRINQNDTSPAIKFALTPTSINLVGATVQFHMRNEANMSMKVDASALVISSVNDPTVGYEWQAADTDTVGLFRAEFEVTYSDGTIETFPNDGTKIMVKISDDLA